jgi:hypothetical protein
MRDNGGAAFPRPFSIDTEGDYQVAVAAQNGMSLRDYFAAKAIQWARMGNAVTDPEALAKYCYQIADAMLEARR